MQVRAFGACFSLEWKEQMSDLAAYLLMLMHPVLTVVAIVYLSGPHGTEGILGRAVAGGGLAAAWDVLSIRARVSIEGERQTGKLLLLMATPARLPVIVGGRMLAGVCFTMTSFAFTFLTVMALSPQPLTLQRPWLLCLALLAAVLSLAAFSLLLASLYTVWEISYWRNAVGPYLYILSGLFFPTTLLPVWVQGVGKALPHYWANQCLMAALSGVSPSRAVWIGLVSTSLLYLVLAFPLYRVIERRARNLGTLE